VPANILTLEHSAEHGGLQHVSLKLRGRTGTLSAAASFRFELSDGQREDLRWYLEDYLRFPYSLDRAIAGRVEGMLRDVGKELMDGLCSQPDARELWHAALEDPQSTAVEIVSADASAPWELLLRRGDSAPVSIDTAAFVHRARTARRPAAAPADGPLRVLLVICRPAGDRDVPFRSVAMRLLGSLGEMDVRVELLRPPTWESFQERLAQETYDVVHFDGHGVYRAEGPDGSGRRRGYLVFESSGGHDLIDGELLGKALAATQTRFVVMNACRSAFAEPAAAPRDGAPGSPPLGSLVQELVDWGVPAVVGMRYVIYPVTAAAFVAELYAAIANGQPLPVAATAARRRMFLEPSRDAGTGPVDLADWCVPQLHVATPLIPDDAPPQRFRARPPTPSREVGRDEVVLALERAFARGRPVVLHGPAGSGKTTTAHEFLRWSADTGGADVTLVTSFEEHVPYPLILGALAQAVGGDPTEPWVSGSESVVLERLAGVKLLWLWDNVEPIAGFPQGERSRWSAAEQDGFASLAQRAAAAGARVLLTSRRDERGWLGEERLPVPMPPLNAVEAAALARSLVSEGLDGWRPLIDRAGGNPLTLVVMLRQAVAQGCRTREDVEGFVNGFDAAGWAGDRDSPLAASLSYGFERAFTGDVDRRTLSLLSLFRGFVDTAAIAYMGNPELGALPELDGFSGEDAGRLLDRAVDIGLVTKRAPDAYDLHPAVPWFLKRHFERWFGADPRPAVRAFCWSLGGIGAYYHDNYVQGRRDVVRVLALQEANLLHAWELARRHDFPAAMISTMQGLRVLYEHQGRSLEWARLVEEVEGEFAEPSGGPREGLEAEWILLNEYRVSLARGARRYEHAERLQRLRVEVDRRRDSLANLAASLRNLGDIRRRRGSPDCLAEYAEARELFERLGDQQSLAGLLAAIADAHCDIAEIYDLDEAEALYQQADALLARSDRVGRSQMQSWLGSVDYLRFRDGRKAGVSAEMLRPHVVAAREHFQSAARLAPGDALLLRAQTTTQLATITELLGDGRAALEWHRRALKLHEQRGDRRMIATTYLNMAISLEGTGDLDGALQYARSADELFAALDGSTSDERENASFVVQDLEKRLNKRRRRWRLTHPWPTRQH
jgi:tetratricopeptide (TPR) repeat protein